jgi:hypothetical protein
VNHDSSRMKKTNQSQSRRRQSPINNNNNSGTRSLKVSHSDSLRKDNSSLIRLLKVIEQAGKDGISTTKLCEQAFKSRNYGMRVIKKAYDDGYIKRFGKNKRGHDKVNYLSDKGEELLNLLEKNEEEE